MDKPVSSDISEAFAESLEDFGTTGKAALVSNLQRRGVFLDDKRISLKMLYEVLVELLGEQATEMVMESVIIAMDKFHSERMATRTRDSMTR